MKVGVGLTDSPAWLWMTDVWWDLSKLVDFYPGELLPQDLDNELSAIGAKAVDGIAVALSNGKWRTRANNAGMCGWHSLEFVCDWRQRLITSLNGRNAPPVWSSANWIPLGGVSKLLRPLHWSLYLAVIYKNDSSGSVTYPAEANVYLTIIYIGVKVHMEWGQLGASTEGV